MLCCCMNPKHITATVICFTAICFTAIASLQYEHKEKLQSAGSLSAESKVNTEKLVYTLFHLYGGLRYDHDTCWSEQNLIKI